MINRLSESHLTDIQFIALSNEQIMATVKHDAGFDDKFLPTYEIDSKGTRLTIIFEDCVSRVMISRHLTDSQKVKEYWDLVDLFTALRRECMDLKSTTAEQES